ncbi:hypothetical protein HWC81_gp36 [Gordonia phage Crocheter]|uniref:Uncharacterized protein n=1 Tax=Gordonia phage Crocheter TaxID=2656532 RepID=A0A649VEK7_9CAUD|nr:hypothetical protein HWC81_gp36 [Gordonia phage Crocheter]QGJ90382.1 hypothetical protein PBI_CROCHETER_36 [Gordonia phage Crocheter]
MDIFTQVGTLLVAVIAALSAYATQRQASKANHRAQMENHRAQMELEAFDRARAFDSETIIRQNEMVGQQRREIDRLRNENNTLSELRSECIRKHGGCPDTVDA